MSIVAGVDFGTLSVRASLFDSARGRLGAGVAEYPLLRKPDDPDFATQSHADHMRALAEAMRSAIAEAGIDGQAVEALALDTTGSSVIPWLCVAKSGSSGLRRSGYSATPAPRRPRALSNREARTLRVPKSTPATILISG